MMQYFAARQKIKNIAESSDQFLRFLVTFTKFVNLFKQLKEKYAETICKHTRGRYLQENILS